jgi:hypothetical protein
VAAHRRFEKRLIGLLLSAIRKLTRRRENAAPSVYLAYSIGPEPLATAVHELDAQNDEAALSEATPLFNDKLKRVEVWCGSRKVGDIPSRKEMISDGGAVRDSA